MTGSHMVQLLLKRGHTVRVLAHNEDDRSMRLQELVFYGNARVTEGGAVDLLQRLARTIWDRMLTIRRLRCGTFPVRRIQFKEVFA